MFEKPENGWADMSYGAKLMSSDLERFDYFGSSVSISDSTIVVGAIGDDDRAENSGAAYLFFKPDDGWADATENVKLWSSDVNGDKSF